MENTNQTFDKKPSNQNLQPEIIASQNDLDLQPNPVTKRWYWPASFSERLALVFWGVLFLALIPRLVTYLAHSFEVISWPYQIDYDEGLNLSTAWNVAQGQNIYLVNPADHFIAAPYPPLYFILNAFGIKLWGVQLQVGRIISFAASLAIAGMISWAVNLALKRTRISQLNAGGASLIAGLMWFVPAPVFIWGTIYKQDLFAIAIALLAILLVYRWRDNPWLWLTAPIMATAFFAKQNELLAVGVGCGYMLLYNWRRGWKLTILTAFCLAVPFVLLNILTNNGYYNHTIAYQLVPWRLNEFILRMNRLIIDHLVFIIIGLVALLSYIIAFRRGFSRKEWRNRLKTIPQLSKEALFPIYLCAGFFSLFTVGAYQGNYNLTLDLFPPLLIMVSTWLAQQVERLGKVEKSKERQLALLIASMLLVVMSWQVLSFGDVKNYFPFTFMPNPTRRTLMENLQRQIAAAPPGDLLTDDIYLALSARRNVPYDNLYHILIESSFSKWDDSRFLQDIRDHRFSLVIHDANPIRFSDRAWDILNANYEMVFNDDIDVWKPRK